MKISNKTGYILHGFIEGDEQHLVQNIKPITASVVVLQSTNKFLFGFNINRKQWELPGGRIEPGESPYQCAVRELKEESSQSVTSLDFAGLAHMHRPSGDFKYTAVYSSGIEELEPFSVNEEWNKIKLRESGENDGADLIHLELVQRICC